MSVLLLARHGQASFGAADYDALSERGHEQARVLGRSLAERGLAPDAVVAGGQRRHAETVRGITDGLAERGVTAPPAEVDRGFDEFDFGHVLDVFAASSARVDVPGAAASDPLAGFQAHYEAATERWASGLADADYDETFGAFRDRVTGAATRAAARPGRVVLAVSSGGPIGLLASLAVSGDAWLWPAFNRVAVNAAVTKMISGRRGLTLVTYNDHAHLEHDRELVTYR